MGRITSVKKQAKLISGGFLTIVDHLQLAFDSHEAMRLFEGFDSLEDQVHSGFSYIELLQITAGWPIVLRLLRLKVDDKKTNLADFLATLEKISKEELYEYLVEDYWASFEQPFRDVLVKTSIYYCFDRSDAQAITPGTDITAYWAKLLHSFPFVVKKEENLLEYQGMFHGFLNECLLREYSPAAG